MQGLRPLSWLASPPIHEPSRCQRGCESRVSRLWEAGLSWFASVTWFSLPWWLDLLQRLEDESIHAQTKSQKTADRQADAAVSATIVVKQVAKPGEYERCPSQFCSHPQGGRTKFPVDGFPFLGPFGRWRLRPIPIPTGVARRGWF